MEGSFSTVPLEVNELQIAADDSLTNLILDSRDLRNPLRDIQITCLVVFILVVIALIFSRGRSANKNVYEPANKNVYESSRTVRTDFYD